MTTDDLTPAAPEPTSPSPHVTALIPAALAAVSDAAVRDGLRFMAEQFEDAGLLTGLNRAQAIVQMVTGIDAGLSPSQAIQLAAVTMARTARPDPEQAPPPNVQLAAAPAAETPAPAAEAPAEPAKPRAPRPRRAPAAASQPAPEAAPEPASEPQPIPAPEPTPAPEPAPQAAAEPDELPWGAPWEEAPAEAPEVEYVAPDGALPAAPAGSFLARVMLEAKGPEIGTGPKGEPLHRMNSALISRMVLDHLMTTYTDQAAALTLIKKKMQDEWGAGSSADLSNLQLIALVSWAEGVVSRAQQAAPRAATPAPVAPPRPAPRPAAAPTEVPAFDPQRGSRAKPVDYDAEIMTAFETLAGQNRDHLANEVFTETGYAQLAEDSTPQVKAETLSKLNALLEQAA